tara:strand:+ start:479 stop:907 length:429 start_codon:yes stop_codon:yes gene_type:complete
MTILVSNRHFIHFLAMCTTTAAARKTPTLCTGLVVVQLIVFDDSSTVATAATQKTQSRVEQSPTQLLFRFAWIRPDEGHSFFRDNLMGIVDQAGATTQTTHANIQRDGVGIPMPRDKTNVLGPTTFASTTQCRWHRMHTIFA